MSDWGEYPRYVSVGERRAKNEEALARLRKKNAHAAPVVIQGRKLARTWWGQAWNDNLESYRDLAYRLERGRSYVRHGAVLDLTLEPGRVTARVQGSRSKPYRVTVRIRPLLLSVWETLVRGAEGRLQSMAELAGGRFPRDLADLFTAPGTGLFPAPGEIAMECSCPDVATLCKHVAATLYGVGARLDEDPTRFFVLRQVQVAELIAAAVSEQSRALLERAGTASPRVLDDAGLGELFGIDLRDRESPGGAASSAQPAPRPGKDGKGWA